MILDQVQESSRILSSVDRKFRNYKYTPYVILSWKSHKDTASVNMKVNFIEIYLTNLLNIC